MPLPVDILRVVGASWALTACGDKVGVLGLSQRSRVEPLLVGPDPLVVQLLRVDAVALACPELLFDEAGARIRELIVARPDLSQAVNVACTPGATCGLVHDVEEARRERPHRCRRVMFVQGL